VFHFLAQVFRGAFAYSTLSIWRATGDLCLLHRRYSRCKQQALKKTYARENINVDAGNWESGEFKMRLLTQAAKAQVTRSADQVWSE
jgi:hypothetical protein